MKKAFVFVVSGLLALSLLLTGCGGTQDNNGDTSQAKSPDATASSSTPAKATNAPPLVIGVVTSQTGPLAVTGKESETGVKEAAMEWQQKTGQEVKVIVEDDTSTPDGAKAAFTKLATQKPTAIFAPSPTNLTVALMDQIKQSQVPVFMCAGANPGTQVHGGWLLQICTNAGFVAPIYASVVKDQLAAKKPAVIFPSASKSAAAPLTPAFEKAGIPLVASEEFKSDQDLPNALQNVKAAGADLLIVFAGAVDAAKATLVAKQMNLGLPILGGAGFGTTQFAKLAGAAKDGTYAAPFSLTGMDAESKPFVDAVHKNFSDQDVTWTLGQYYDGAMILFNTVQKVSSTDPTKVRDAILAIHDYQGVSGTFNFDANGSGRHDMTLAHWQGDQITKIKVVTLSN